MKGPTLHPSPTDRLSGLSGRFVDQFRILSTGSPATMLLWPQSSHFEPQRRSLRHFA